MDDRERIATALFHARHESDDDFDLADAVLAALGDRLLPELPEAWVMKRLEWLAFYPNLFGITMARIDGIGYVVQERYGAGPTIAAAIREALGEVRKEEQ